MVGERKSSRSTAQDVVEEGSQKDTENVADDDIMDVEEENHQTKKTESGEDQKDVNDDKNNDNEIDNKDTKIDEDDKDPQSEEDAKDAKHRNNDSNNENEEEEEEDDDDDEEEEEEKYVVPQRSTRGKRMSELVGEAAEADEEFWAQDAWKELEDDDDILSDEYDSDEKKDIEDSDFSDVDEDLEERERVQQAIDQEEEQKRNQKRDRAKRRKGIYVDPALKPATKKRPRTEANDEVEVGEKKKAPRARNIAIPYRRSTRETTRVQSQATEDLTRQRVERAKVVPKKVREPLVRLTQQELLEEAARTEIENKRSLELMLMLQEEKKREKQTAEKQVSKRIIYFSSARNVKVGPDHKPTPPPISTLTFTYVDQVPSVINAKPKPKPERPICSVTGLPAKYRDPVTGIYFRTVEAFKLLRGSHTAPKASGPSSGAL